MFKPGQIVRSNDARDDSGVFVVLEADIPHSAGWCAKLALVARGQSVRVYRLQERLTCIS